ncbi:MAG: hypothetical protein KGY76_06150, partial [Candidatus Thermoplasmatota archaeon]|nr:hypothetical protein [Candidatus Thermoplasmatota archaeon]
TYTVSDIGYYDHENTTYYAYNLTLSGTVLNGSIEIEDFPSTIAIDGGSVSGYKICRVADLGIVKHHQFRHLYGGSGEGYSFDGWNLAITSSQPVVETYDFPLRLGERFWSNSTIRNRGYQSYEISTDWGDYGDNTSYDDEMAINGVIDINQTKQNIEVPEGNFDSYFINSTGVQGESSYIQRSYNASVKSFVKEYADTQEQDWRKVLTDYSVTFDENEGYVEPSEAWVYDEVTVLGAFPNNTNADLTVRIPSQYGSDIVWNTTTNNTGGYKKTIQMPFALDHTPTNIDFSSVGMIVQVDESPKENFTVTTITLHLDKHRVSLHEGWNLISTNLELWNDDLKANLDMETYGIEGMYSKVMYPKENDSGWKSYLSGRRSYFNDLEKIDLTRGLWIRAKANISMTFLGFKPSTTNITLEPGWNLVGYPSATEKSASDVLPTEVSKVGVYDETGLYNITYVRGLSGLKLKPGSGYWVYNNSTEPVQWTIEN